MKRYSFFRAILLFWTAFIGLGAVAGSVGMLTAIDGSNLGMQDLLPFFQVLPFADALFQNFLFPGISLLVVNGLTNLTAFVLILRHSRKGIFLGGLFGFTLMLWITIQFIIFPFNLLSTAYFIFGVLQLIAGIVCYISMKQMDLQNSLVDYKNPASSDTLVVTFSRKGHCLKLALDIARQRGARLLELKTAEPTEGDLGFWWCGRFGMHGWPMPLERYAEDVSSYQHVVIVTAVWAFRVSCPIKAFAIQERGRIKEAEYFICHFSYGMSYSYIAVKLDELLGIKAAKASSICCQGSRQGRIIAIR
ncbi:MAG: hypothetical protein PHI83_07420 [Sphaerochaetaceae bacterium]|jgi:hypothetical protein|nr:hypothetical protein [Sphaerochaetaceae bacterium]